VKIERATAHIAEAQRLIQEYVQLNPYERFGETDAGTGEHVSKIRVRVRLPHSLPAIVGDAVNNLRAALDHMAVALTGNGDAYFPIVSAWDAKQAAAFERKVNGASAAAIAVIKEVQPCFAANPSAAPLAVIQALNNKDKHRALMILNSAAKMRKFSMESPDGGGIQVRSFTVHPNVVLFENEAELMRYHVVPETEVHMQATHTCGVAFAESGPVHGKGVVEVLKSLAEAVTAIADRLTPLAP
jgi:hypothetical protein